jgi:hemerythrin-like domain-containing protein
MPIGIPEAMREEHEELHDELRKATRMVGKVGKAARRVAEVLHPHFERENELALPVIGIARELAEGKISPDFPKALELCEKFKVEYDRMLEEHVEIVKALSELEKAAKKAKKASVVDFARKLRMHAKTEEDLTYPAVLMIGKALKETA